MSAHKYPKTSRHCLVVGSVAIDRVATPHGQSDNILGGAASYASIAASYFTQARLVGIVGGDFPKTFLNRFKKHGIDTEGLQIDHAGKTFYWSGQYHENFAGRSTLEIQLNVFEKFSPTLPNAYQQSPYVMLGAIQPSLQHHVLDQLKAKNAFVLADTFDLWIKTTRDDFDRLLPRIDLLVINEDESRLLTGETSLIVAGRKLRKMGPRIVVLKKGEHGSLLFHPDGFFAIPAYPVTKFIDPTGAGDSYAGALIGYLASVNRTDFAALKKAVAYATAAASLTVESFSVDRLSRAGRPVVDARYRELEKMTRF